jgi:serine/threonine protein kinase
MLNFRFSSGNQQIKFNKQLKEYNILSTIGEGTYGKVKLAIHIASNETVAIKIIEKSKLLRVNDSHRIKNEMKLIMEFDHPNVIKAFEVFEDENCFYIVMEHPNNGDLFSYLCKKTKLTLTEASKIFFQIVNAIDYIHSNKVVHRDMKPENFMLTEDMIVKLVDFGFSSKYVNNKIKLDTNCGSICYSPPEMLRKIKYYPQPVDIWGLGVILFMLIYGELPFSGDREDVVYRKIIHCEYTFPHVSNSNVKNLIKRIFVANPLERITIEEIKTHPIYYTGKANFTKLFKIYNDNGFVLPIVKEYIKHKVIKYLKSECSMEINLKNVEELTAYKIVYYKYLHKIPWHNYHIHYNIDKSNKLHKKIQPTLNTKTSLEKGMYEKNFGHKIYATSTPSMKSSKNHKRNSIDLLLTIPVHKELGITNLTLSNFSKSKNEDKKVSEKVAKYGTITHSYDKRYMKFPFVMDNINVLETKNNRPCSTEIKKEQRNRSSNKMNSIKNKTQKFCSLNTPPQKEFCLSGNKLCKHNNQFYGSGRRIPFKI